MTADAARNLGMTLHELVAELDPVKWRDEKRAQLEASFAEFRKETDALLAEWSTERGTDAVRTKLDETRGVIAEKLPSADDVKSRWMEFRTEIHPAYEDLAAALRSAHMELPSVRPTNYVRSLFHVLSAFVAVLFVEYTPWNFVIAVPIAVAIFFWFLEIMRRRSDKWNEMLMKMLGVIAHPHERYRVNSSTWFATALSVLALTHQPIAGVAAVTVLGVGDPAAGLVGRKFGKTKLVNGRSLEGTLTFAVVSFAAVMGVLAVWHSDLSLGMQASVAGIAAVVGALVELFSRRIDDNFAIPVFTGLVIWAFLVLV